MKKRTDGWSTEDDIILAETVIEFIKCGRTQLDAFDKLSQVLNRSSAAIGYRWNGVLRKEYESRVNQAKFDSKKLKNNQMLRAVKADFNPLQLVQRSTRQDNTVSALYAKIKTLESENERLRSLLNVKNPTLAAQEDLQTLLQIVERAISLGHLKAN